MECATQAHTQREQEDLAVAERGTLDNYYSPMLIRRVRRKSVEVGAARETHQALVGEGWRSWVFHFSTMAQGRIAIHVETDFFHGPVVARSRKCTSTEVPADSTHRPSQCALMFLQ